MTGPANTEREVEQALERCAREPIHIPGAIQPAGALLTLDTDFGRILQASENTSAILGMAADELIDAQSELVLGRNAVQRLRRLVERAAPRTHRTLEIDCPTPAGRGRLHVNAHRGDDCVIVELEPIDHPPHRDAELWTKLNQVLSELQGYDDPQTLMDEAVAAVRRFTGHERVMLYLFDDQWNGRVTAESRIGEVDSYIGHHFPASDIPPQARALYESSRVRLIFDVDAEPVPLVPRNNPLSGEPLDLGAAILRAVSPIHLQYLRNMNVGSSMSVAVQGRDELRGLIACHSRGGGDYPTPRIRKAIDTLARFLSERMLLLDREIEDRFRRNALALRMELADDPTEDVERMLELHGQRMLELLEADGVALVHGSAMATFSEVPAPAVLKRLTGWLAREAGTDSLATDRVGEVLPAEFPAADMPPGLLAARLRAGETSTWLLLFRRAVVRITDWGGDPNKPIDLDASGPRLAPRHSFATWREENRDRSQPWTPLVLELARELGQTLALILFNSEVQRLNTLLAREQETLAERNRELEVAGRTDAMTGACNRRYLGSLIEGEIEVARRHARPFSVIFIDIDHFKDINDTHGHATGDEVLKGVVGIVSSALRAGDRLGRWGGEEFLVFLPGTGLDGARALAERLRASIEEGGGRTPVAVTASLGVAGHRNDESLDQLIHRADQALYQAKNEGRNRVCTAAD